MAKSGTNYTTPILIGAGVGLLFWVAYPLLLKNNLVTR